MNSNTYPIRPETRYTHGDGETYYMIRTPSDYHARKWVLERETETIDGKVVVNLSKAAMWTLYWNGGVEGPL